MSTNEFDLTVILALQTVWHPCKEHTNFQRTLSLEICLFVVTKTHFISNAYWKPQLRWRLITENSNATHLTSITMIIKPMLMYNLGCDTKEMRVSNSHTEEYMCLCSRTLTHSPDLLHPLQQLLFRLCLLLIIFILSDCWRTWNGRSTPHRSRLESLRFEVVMRS